jgi:6-phosphogluconolactonase
VLDPQSGALASAGTTAVAGSPSFLAVDPARRHLYAVDEATAGQIEAFSIDPSNGALAHLGDVSSGGNGPAHVSVDPSGKWVLVANYGDGTVSVLPVGAGGALGTASDTRSAGKNAHQILADATSRWVFVPCLGADYVAQYGLYATGKLASNQVPTAPTAAGAGPRHLAFHPSAPFVYLIDETDSTMSAWSYDTTTGRLSSLEAPLSTRAAGATGTNTGAELVVHPTGKWLYGSNRGDDTIALFALGSDGKMTAIGQQQTGGQTPRSFTIDPSGRWLLVAGQASNDVRVFAVDATTARSPGRARRSPPPPLRSSAWSSCRDPTCRWRAPSI